MTAWMENAPEVIDCGCGCGGTLTDRDSRNRPRRFLAGHNKRIYLAAPDAAVASRTRHNRSADLLVSVTQCAWQHIGDCSNNRTDVAHVNGDDTDNRQSNLLRLCRRHHSLLDLGRIDPTDPVMPPYFTDGSGKRRYRYVRRSEPSCRWWKGDRQGPRCRLPKGHDGPHDLTAPTVRDLMKVD